MITSRKPKIAERICVMSKSSPSLRGSVLKTSGIR